MDRQYMGMKARMKERVVGKRERTNSHINT